MTARLAIDPEQLLPPHDGKRSVERVQLGDLNVRGVFVGPTVIIGIGDVRRRFFAGFRRAGRQAHDAAELAVIEQHAHADVHERGAVSHQAMNDGPLDGSPVEADEHKVQPVEQRDIRLVQEDIVRDDALVHIRVQSREIGNFLRLVLKVSKRRCSRCAERVVLGENIAVDDPDFGHRRLRDKVQNVSARSAESGDAYALTGDFCR